MGLRYRIVALALAAATTVAGVTPGVAGGRPAATAQAGEAGGAAAVAVDPGLRDDLAGGPVSVTLVTGDRVTVALVDDQVVTNVRPGPGREDVPVATQRAGEHLYVVPADANALLSEGRVDRRLFDVAGLIDAGYDDASRPDVPLIVQSPTAVARAAEPGVPAEGAPGAVPADDVAAAGAAATEYPDAGATALSQPKATATEFWDQVVTAGAPTPDDGLARTLAAPIGTLWLDGQRRALLDESVPQVGAPDAWAAGFTGDGVRVAVLDTGIDTAHPDLAANVVESVDFTDEATTDDLFGHGTHVASIVAGSGAASDGRYRGVAPDADLLNGKVCDQGGGCFESDILEGMEWAAGSGARVVNLSLGGPDTPEVDPLEAAVDSLSAAHGTLFVIAAGNDGPDGGTLGSPSTADAALAVGAVDDADRPAGFSSRGPRVGDAALKPEISAPGVGIVAARATNGYIGEPVGEGYVALDGTSMATPHVAGAAAIVAQQHPDWTGQQLKALLVGSATPTAGVDAFAQGAGRLDVGRAVGQQVTTEPVALSAGRPAWPHDDDEPVTQAITYRNPGTAPVTLALTLATVGPEGAAPDGMFALAAEEITVPAGGEAAVDVTTNPAVPGPDGHYSAFVTATAGDTVVTTPVGVDREPESYELTLEFLDDAGQLTPAYSALLFGLTNFMFDFPYDGDGRVTQRLERGEYLAEGLVFGADGSSALLVAPSIQLDGDRTVTFDAREADPVSITIPRARMVLAGGFFSYDRRGPSGSLNSAFILDDFGGLRLGQVGPDLPADQLVSSVQGTWAVPDAEGGFAASDLFYELAWFDVGGILPGLTQRVREDRLAVVRSTYQAVGDDRLGAALFLPRPTAGPAVDSAWWDFGMPLPHQRRTFVNVGGLSWGTGLIQEVVDPDSEWPFPDFETMQDRPAQRLRAGQTYRETWNQGVLGPNVTTPGRFCYWGGSQRAGDTITVAIPQLGDAAGHPGCAWAVTEGRTTLSRNGEVIGETPEGGYGEFAVPAEAGDYRLEVEMTRPPSAALSTRTSSVYTFPSAHGDGEAAPLPLLSVRFRPPLDAHNRMVGGDRVRIPIAVDRLGDVSRPGALAVEVSFDDGGTWTAVPARRHPDHTFSVAIDHPATPGFVSLRATAADSRGHAVTQTIVRAYEVVAPPAA